MYKFNNGIKTNPHLLINLGQYHQLHYFLSLTIYEQAKRNQKP